MLMLTLVFAVSMVIVYLLAKKRQADTVFWVVMAFVVGPLAIPFVFFAKSKRKS